MEPHNQTTPVATFLALIVQSVLTVGSFRAPGIALAATPGADPLALCLKSGKLGAVDMLAPTLQLMAGNATYEKVIDGEHV